jgi:hypothetical protein
LPAPSREFDRRIEGIASYLAAFHPDDDLVRSARLGTTLKILSSQGHDLGPILTALEDGIEVWQRERVRRANQQDARDTIETGERARRGARVALANMEKLYAGWNEEGKLLVALRELISELDDELSRIHEQKPRLRLPRRGKPQEHVTLIHQRLKALGVAKLDRTALLQILDFVPDPDAKLSR